jgi:hypothetical protein
MFSRASFRAVHITLSLPCRVRKKQNRGRVKRYWEIIANNLSKAGWSCGCVSAIDSNGRTIWIADAHRDDGQRFVVHADEKLTVFLMVIRRLRRFSQASSRIGQPPITVAANAGQSRLMKFSTNRSDSR